MLGGCVDGLAEVALHGHCYAWQSHLLSKVVESLRVVALAVKLNHARARLQGTQRKACRIDVIQSTCQLLLWARFDGSGCNTRKR